MLGEPFFGEAAGFGNLGRGHLVLNKLPCLGCVFMPQSGGDIDPLMRADIIAPRRRVLMHRRSQV